VSLRISDRILAEIHAYGESRYPEEAAGLILGTANSEDRIAQQVLPLENSFEQSQRSRRYLIEPQEMLRAEQQAEQLGMDVIGVFHSHPDHPPAPSQFDLHWAVPWYVYLITSVQNGIAEHSRVWRLLDDHSSMVEEQLNIHEENR
jgi:proteasome lid subunit RPN8/RPN11